VSFLAPEMAESSPRGTPELDLGQTCLGGGTSTTTVGARLAATSRAPRPFAIPITTRCSRRGRPICRYRLLTAPAGTGGRPL
jgi:hypothetical protein